MFKSPLFRRVGIYLVLSTADLKGKALIVHAGGDTYRDEPPLGGGGARVACGVVPDER